MKEQKTAEQIIREKIKEYSASTVNIDVDNIPAFTHFLFVAIDAMQVYSDQQNAELRNQIADLERENSEYRAVYDSVVKNRDEMSGQLQSETESRKYWQRQAQRYQKYHKELNSALERVKELEAKLSEVTEIDEEDDTAWGRMKEIRVDDYDLESEREEEIFQFAFFEGIKYVQKALKK